MKRMMACAIWLLAAQVQAAELGLEIHGSALAGKPIRIAVCAASAQQDFPLNSAGACRTAVLDADSDRLTVSFKDLPPGTYAVAAFSDSNRNGRLDKNVVGVPSEPYGFSNDARGIFGPPGFAEAAFEVGAAAVSQTIHLH